MQKGWDVCVCIEFKVKQIADAQLCTQSILFQILQTNSGIPGSDEIQQFIAVLTHERFDVVTGHIVPLNAIIVEVV